MQPRSAGFGRGKTSSKKEKKKGVEGKRENQEKGAGKEKLLRRRQRRWTV